MTEPSFVRAIRADTLPDGSVRGAKVHGHHIAIARVDGDVAALAAQCSHAGGALDQGTLAGETLVCPLHGSRFGTEDGRVCRGPARRAVQRFPTRERDGWIEVAVDA